MNEMEELAFFSLLIPCDTHSLLCCLIAVHMLAMIGQASSTCPGLVFKQQTIFPKAFHVIITIAGSKWSTFSAASVSEQRTI